MGQLIFKDKKRNIKVCIEVSGSSTGDEFVEDGIKPLMLAIGYHPDTVDSALGTNDWEREIEEEDG